MPTVPVDEYRADPTSLERPADRDGSRHTYPHHPWVRRLDHYAAPSNSDRATALL